MRDEMLTIERTPNWYIVWYWADEYTYTRKFFSDYDDAVFFARTKMTNINPETGMRYGIISANSLDPEICQRMWLEGTDLHWEDREAEIRDEVLADEDCAEDDKEAEIQSRIEREGDRWYDDEPIHAFELDCPGYGIVYGQTTWLGGAQLVWIFRSPFIAKAKLCSPCVPGAGDLDNLDPDGYECYDVPNDWRAE